MLPKPRLIIGARAWSLRRSLNCPRPASFTSLARCDRQGTWGCADVGQTRETETRDVSGIGRHTGAGPSLTRTETHPPPSDQPHGASGSGAARASAGGTTKLQLLQYTLLSVCALDFAVSDIPSQSPMLILKEKRHPGCSAVWQPAEFSWPKGDKDRALPRKQP